MNQWSKRGTPKKQQQQQQQQKTNKQQQQTNKTKNKQKIKKNTPQNKQTQAKGQIAKRRKMFGQKFSSLDLVCTYPRYKQQLLACLTFVSATVGYIITPNHINSATFSISTRRMSTDDLAHSSSKDTSPHFFPLCLSWSYHVP